MSNEAGPKKQRGCFFYGCLSLVVLTLVITLCVGVGLYFAKQKLDSLINDYTATGPEKIEELVYPEPQMRELQARLGAFREGADKGTNAVELVLTADDLNALIAQNRDLKGKIFVKIEDDQLKGQVSFPLPEIPLLRLKGRFLNGSAAFKVALQDSRLDVRIEQASVKDKPLPAVFLEELKKQDLSQEIQKDPEARRAMSRIESLELRDGKVFIRSKATGGTAGPPAGQPPAPAPAPR